MIIPDINLLVYAYNEDSPWHASARAWWEDTLSDDVPVGIVWAVVLGFVRLMTHSAVVMAPLPPDAACTTVRSWLAQPCVELLSPGPRHLTIFEGLLKTVGVGGNLVTDAHIAAIAIEIQGEVHSSDADFGRFPGLRWRNPLRPRLA